MPSKPFSLARIPAAIRILAIVAIPLLLLMAFAQFRGAAAQEECTASQMEEGGKLYAENCTVCHGPDGQGRVGATLAKDWPSIRPDLRVRGVIENGVPGSPMPAWSQARGGPLEENQIDSLVCYVLSWQTTGAPVIYPTPTALPRPQITAPPGVTGDPNAGAVLYDQNCFVCHGPEGQGRIGAPLAKDWPSVRPDLQVRALIERGVEGSPMPAWSQANGGPLNENEIDNLVAYILTWSTPPNPGTLAPTPAPETPAQGTGWLVGLIVIVLVALGIAGGLYLARRQGP